MKHLVALTLVYGSLCSTPSLAQDRQELPLDQIGYSLGLAFQGPIQDTYADIGAVGDRLQRDLNEAYQRSEKGSEANAQGPELAFPPPLSAVSTAAADDALEASALEEFNEGGLGSGTPGFEENKGQITTTAGEPADFVRFRLTDGNTKIFLLTTGIAYQFERMHKPEGMDALERDARRDPSKREELDALREQVGLETYRMDMVLEGADATARVSTEGRSSDYTQYYNHDALDVHSYTRVTYHDVYPGIDWVIYTTDKGMKYDFVVRPGADPAQIQLRFKDHEELRVEADGSLIHGNRMGRFTEDRPVSYQNDHEVNTRFLLEGDKLVFAIDAYDRSEPLTIDPVRIWATYYGGGNVEEGLSCATDDDGNVFLAGITESTSAIASGGHDNTINGGTCAFLVKFNDDGVRQWGTYYGNGSTYGSSCTTDGSGNVFLAGDTWGGNVASGGHQNTQGGNADAFLVKFNDDGVPHWRTPSSLNFTKKESAFPPCVF